MPFRRHKDYKPDLSGLRITPEVSEAINSFYKRVFENPTSYTAPTFMQNMAKSGRWDANAAEKFAYQYFTEEPVRKQQIDDEVTPACWRAVLAAPKGTAIEMSAFTQTVMNEVKAYIAEHKFGLETKEREELFSRYALLINYQEAAGGKLYDFYDVGFEEYNAPPPRYE
ncbi:uncharacterized protein BDV14DRAFT_197932 [Aspergillus stella-maris]|uniref:uncharacterized protein n=1 Tax=Aspergillus stella-maris TaxID=1810926 RepID=UPI003CCE50F2